MKNKKRLLLVSLFFLIALSIMQFTVANIIGFDGYIHIKSAEIIKKKGFIDEFPWAENIILSESYADIHLLFRILLIPFTYFGLGLGAKLAAILFAALAFVIFYWFLSESKIKYPFFWSVLYLFTAESLMYRFMLPRQMPLVVALLLLTIYFLQRKRYLLLAIASFAFVWLHSSFVFQLLIVLLYFILEKIFRKKFDIKLLIFPAAGTLLGLSINPYFPNNVFLIFTQIFKVNLLSNLFNAEWKPWPFIDFVKNNILVLFYLGISSFILFKEKKLSQNKALYLFLALFFFAYTIKSRRMQEFLVPFSLLSVSVFANSYFENCKNSKTSKLFGASLLIIIAILNFSLLREEIINNNFFHNFDNCSAWIGENVPQDSLIFTNVYAFPYLFLNNDNIRYTHGIDLTYSYLHDEDKFGRYMGILQGALESDTDYILKDYDPDYVFSGKIKQDVQLFNYVVSHKENYKAAYEDDWCVVLEVIS